MLAEFRFLRPEWLVALPFVIGLAVYFARRRFGSGSWETVVSPALAPYVLSRSRGRSSDRRWLLFGLVGVLATLALAGPAWERIEQPVFRSDQALVVALDLSRSMDAQDISPSRLARARLKILDLLDRRESGQTALIVYSANAFTVTPLTTDTDTVRQLVNSLDTNIMPSRGSYPVAAINKGRQLLEQAAVSSGEVLLVTDGGSSPAAERLAGDLRDKGFSLSVLGVGTRDGAPIPRAGGGFVTDNRGKMAVPRLEERSLRGLAAAGGGRYASLTVDNRDLDTLLSGESAGAGAAGGDNQATDQWQEEGPWIVLAMLPLVALAFRRGWLLVVVVMLVPLPEPAHASLWDDLWFNRDQQGRRALEAGEPDRAAELFEDGEWRSVAEYRAGDYAGSASGFAGRGDMRNLYNLGTALARTGDFDSAIEAYDNVLETDPDHADARYNRDLLLEAKQQQEQQQQEGEQQESADSEGQGEESEGNPDPNQQSDAQGQTDGDSEEGDPSERQNEDEQGDLEALQEELERAAEQQNQEPAEQQLSEAELAELRRQQAEEQAMEQWLRRIPNDPGGLLRRKFRYQYQRMGKDQDGNNLWPDDEAQPW